eukprot:TRINITY_DN14871_c0_g1_i2.p1 TRINITY_DN14871_c0_g1~~TRINITY_DN14871_c0_g1_i2.p1  ORF type:complete len:519 (+),score=140.50 TRINITY_DN14871_c0_g1_i2:62-1558(+)
MDESASVRDGRTLTDPSRLHFTQRKSKSPTKRANGGSGSEAVMQEFVRAHMLSILQPFVEQIRDVQAEVQKLTSLTSMTFAEVQRQRDHLECHEKQLSEIQTSIPEMEERLDAVNQNTSTNEQSTVELAADLDKAKSAICRAEEQLQAASAGVEALKASQQEAGADIHRLQGGLLEAEKKLSQHVETRLNNLNKFCKDLNGQHAEHLALSQQTKVLAEGNRQTVKTLTSKLDKKHGEDLEKFHDLSQHTKGLEAKLSLCGRDLQRQNEGLKVQEEEILRVQTELGKLMTFQQAHNIQSELFLSLKETTRRVGKAEDDIAQMKIDSGSEIQRLESNISSAHEKVSQSLTDLQSLKTRQESFSEELRSARQRVGDLEYGHAKLGKRADSLASDVHSLSTWQAGAIERLEVHAAELSKAQQERQGLRQGLESASAEAEHQKGELATAFKGLSKLDSRLEVVQKYITGFGKGLQVRHVVSWFLTSTTLALRPASGHQPAGWR